MHQLSNVTTINFFIFYVQVRSLDDSSIYYISSLTLDAYNLLEKVFSMFAEGSIKGQNCPRGSMGKKLDLKGCNFKPMRGLDMSTIASLLEQLHYEGRAEHTRGGQGVQEDEDSQGPTEGIRSRDRSEDVGGGRGEIP